METLNIGRAKLTWLRGGVNFLDGGAMFGVVPKALWSRKYPVNDKNQIELRTDPILLQIDDKNILIDSGTGKNKLTEKQIRNFGVREEAQVEESLAELNLSPSDIDFILMTHMHYDHASGLTTKYEDEYVSTFKNIPIYTSEIEWAEMKAPNIRSRNTYWEMNWKAIENQVVTFKEEIEVLPGLKMKHTGGHSAGHSLIEFIDGEESFIHMADIMPTHAHLNSLWVLAYDDYPMDSIYAKEKYIKAAISRNAWFVFYHDAYYRSVKFNEEGEIIEAIKRNKIKYK